MSAQLVQVARCLLWQAGITPTDAELTNAWADLAARNQQPTLLDLIALLRERGVVTGSLLQVEESPALLATAAAPLPAADAPAATAAVATVAGPSPAADEPTPPALDTDAGDWSYELVEPIGQGAMGTVYLAWDRHLLRQSAVKQVRGDARGAQDRFLYEAQVLSQLDHPHVLPVYALRLSADGTAACAAKLVRGQTLAGLIETTRGRGPTYAAQTLEDRLETFLKVCDGVAYAHARGVVHRDLKPANVMAGGHGEVYVLDWGLCKLLRRPDEPDFGDAGPDLEAPLQVGVELARTQRGTLRGTPLYLSPEQAGDDPSAVGPRSDQFALGLLLYELIALRCAYEPSQLEAVLEQARAARKRPFPVGLTVEADLAAIVDKATALRPRDRYPSVRALAYDLRRFLRGQETLARPDDLPRAARRWVRRHATGLVGTLVTALLLLLAISTWAVVRGRLAEAERRAATDARSLSEQRVLLELEARAERVVERLLWYQTEVEGLASAAEFALRYGSPTTEPIYTHAHFTDPATAPPDLVAGPGYTGPISPSWPLCDAPAASDPELVQAELRRLLGIRARMQDVFRGSAAGLRAGEAWPRPLQPGVAVEWAYVALESTGAFVVLPGTLSALPAGTDVRGGVVYRAAVAAARASRRQGWSAPYEDALGQGRVISCSRALFDPAGALLGVAGLDLSLDELARRDLTGGGLRWAGIVNGRGEVLISDAAARPRAADPEPPQASGRRTLSLETYHRPFVVAHLQAGAARGIVSPPGEDNTLVAWQRLDPLPWTLLVEVAR